MEKQQEQVEHLWKSLKKVIDRNIYKELYTLETLEEQRNYQNKLESLFIQYACGYKVPKYIVYNSNAFLCLKSISKKRDLDPSKFKKALIQLRQCCQRKNKNPRFI